MNETSGRDMLLNICKLLYERKITVSAGGNMSVRLEDSILITPSGRNKGLLKASEMVNVSMDGKVIGSGKPSIETMMHLALYNSNPHINAIVHCHPLYCTILAVRGEKVKSDLTPEGVLLLGNVPMVGYFTPGTQELVDAVAANASSMAMIMERHGAITQGTTLEEAFNRMEELEFQANLQILAGDVKGLPKSEIKKILGI